MYSESVDADVIIVGAGLAGLTAAVFMSLHGAPPVVIERNSSTSVLPKARGQNPITMEAMRVAGVDDAIRAAIPPGQPRITSLVSESMSGRVLLDHTAVRPDFGRFSPERPGLASQSKVEAALARRAQELGTRIEFDTHCERVEQDDDGVTITIRNRDGGDERQLRCRYLVAADGIRGPIAKQLGVGTHGIGIIKPHTAYRFRADLSAYAPDTASVIHYIQNPDLPDGTGVLVSTDWEHEWVANIPADDARPNESIESIIRRMVGDEDLELEILGSVTYDYGQWVADRLQVGRVFFAGDAAHVMPPTGGQGGNTAQHDGYHLAWKLALVVRGLAGPGLLDSYEPERQAFAEAVTVWQAANLAERRVMDDLAERTGPPMDHATLLFGYVCPDGAFLAEPDHPTTFEDPRSPSGRPGSRVPHVELTGGGETFSPRDRLGIHFSVYTTSPEGASTINEAANGLGVELEAYEVESTDPLGVLGGAVLVRPDGIVAWRGTDPVELEKALRFVLHV